MFRGGIRIASGIILSIRSFLQIGSETARLAADYARDVLKLHKLMLRVFADNVGAVKCYQNAGFVQEACLKDEFLQNGIYRDMLLMAILFEENR